MNARHVRLGLVGLASLLMLLGLGIALSNHTHQSTSLTYVCPMHPTVVQDRMGSCPICKMDLEPKQAAKAEAGEQGLAPRTRYVCPMHADIVSVQPGSSCPICKMDLEPQEEKATAGTLQVSLDRQQRIGLRTDLAQRLPWREGAQFVALLGADESRTYEVNARVNGWLPKVFVSQVGQRVAAGEALAELGSEEVYAAVQQAVVSAPGSSQAEVSASRLAFIGLSQSDVLKLKEQGKSSWVLPLRAPIGGVITDKRVVTGSAIAKGDPLFVISDLSRLWVAVAVDQATADRLKPQDHAVFVASARPSVRYEGEVRLVSASLDPKTSTRMVRVELDNKRGELMPGLAGSVSFSTKGEEAPVLCVPRHAVMFDGGGAYVIVVEGKTGFQARRVMVGRHNTDTYEITKGLAEGESVVSTGAFLIDAEARLAGVLGANGP